MHNDEIEKSLSVLPNDSIFKQRMIQIENNEQAYLNQSFNNDNFFNGYLSKNLGRWMKVEAMLGNNLVTKIGQLIKVGNGFIVLKLNTNPVSSVICETGSIKFITILYSGRIKE